MHHLCIIHSHVKFSQLIVDIYQLHDMGSYTPISTELKVIELPRESGTFSFVTFSEFLSNGFQEVNCILRFFNAASHCIQHSRPDDIFGHLVGSMPVLIGFLVIFSAFSIQLIRLFICKA
ncbi:hypothetical protein RchiOBHm_Chr1g0337441 [Rosa chinensis]|uniref:Uncharacterized protein n=1 Tax=Rosa chinensis TaxID=74649 RepID=A0A2P6SCY3_ROSCH|nr:hypothetical protein RchiOBHm_Chr1g0337441 [Rosa chinensis]